MKKIIFIALVIFVGYKFLTLKKTDEIKPLYELSQVVIYGRDGCAFTQRTIKELKFAKINFVYESVDDKEVANILHAKMRSKGIDTKHYFLPVIELNNNFMIRPNTQDLLNKLNLNPSLK